MKVTVTLGSNRPGGLDVSFAGLACQTYQDFEVVFVDGRYKERHGEVLDAVARYGIKQPFFHVPNHRSSGDIWGVTCGGYNTGFMLAEGEIVIMLMDFAYMPPNWIEAHVELHKAPRLVMAPHQYRKIGGVVAKDGSEDLVWFDDPSKLSFESILSQRERFAEFSLFREPFKPEDLDRYEVMPGDPKVGMGTGPCPHYFMHTKNESFPRETVLAVNGMNEYYDRGRGPGDIEFSWRLTKKGLEGWVAGDATIHCLNPRVLMPNLNALVPEQQRLPAPHDRRQCYKEGEEHYHRVMEGENTWADNPYSLSEKSKAIWSWRQMSQERAPIIESLVASDEVYFK